jgi:thioredoxin reductase (NADPH)
MTSDVIERDLAVVGGGPVGLYAAYYAGFRGLSAAIIDSLPSPGGQVSAMYPEKPIYDVAGFPSIKGRDLVAGLVEQAARFAPTYVLDQRAQQLTRHDDGTIEIGTDKGTAIRAKAVVISGGIGTFTPRPLPTGDEWIGRGLAFFVPSLRDHAGQDVVVVGGGDSACDWALSLEPIALSVTLVHRRAAFRAHAHTVEQLHASSVDVIANAQISKVHGSERVQTVEITATDGTTVIRPASRYRCPRVHRQPRADPRLGRAHRRQPLHPGGHDHGDQPPRRVRGRRHHRLPGQGAPDRGGIRRGGDRREQRRRAHQSRRAAPAPWRRARGWLLRCTSRTRRCCEPTATSA